MKTYRKKIISEVKALEFIYNTEGIDKLTKLCGDKLISVTKLRHIDAKAQAIINVNGTNFVLIEGNYITDTFKIITKKVFEAKYEVFEPAKIYSLGEYFA